MSYLRIDPAWQKKKLMMQDYSYITNFVKMLRAYDMLRRSNQDWIIYPTKNFKSNKTKHLGSQFRPQRLDIDSISQLKITKQDYITFHSGHYLEFSESWLTKIKINKYDRVILYVNPIKHQIGFRFYLNKSYNYHKKRDIVSEKTLSAIEINPQLFHDNKQDILFGYLIYNNKTVMDDLCFERQYIIKITHIINQYLWIQQNIQYQPYFSYIHNRWEVQL